MKMNEIKYGFFMPLGDNESRVAPTVSVGVRLQRTSAGILKGSKCNQGYRAIQNPRASLDGPGVSSDDLEQNRRPFQTA